MTYLVDGNVLSETTKSRPSEAVLKWLARHEPEIVVDPIIIGEIRFGIHVLAAGAKRSQLERWFLNGVQRFHCLAWDANTGLRWARLLADLRRGGHSMPIKDSMIAATALVHGLVIATRNFRDFQHCGVKVLDPFVAA